MKRVTFYGDDRTELGTVELDGSGKLSGTGRGLELANITAFAPDAPAGLTAADGEAFLVALPFNFTKGHVSATSINVFDDQALAERLRELADGTGAPNLELVPSRRSLMSVRITAGSPIAGRAVLHVGIAWAGGRRGVLVDHGWIIEGTPKSTRFFTRDFDAPPGESLAQVVATLREAYQVVYGHDVKLDQWRDAEIRPPSEEETRADRSEAAWLLMIVGVTVAFVAIRVVLAGIVGLVMFVMPSIGDPSLSSRPGIGLAFLFVFGSSIWVALGAPPFGSVIGSRLRHRFGGRRFERLMATRVEAYTPGGWLFNGWNAVSFLATAAWGLVLGLLYALAIRI